MLTAFQELHNLLTSDLHNGNCGLPLSEFVIDSGCDHSAVCDKMVSINPTTTVMAFLGFFPCAGEAVGHSCLLHAPSLHPGHLGEATPFNGKACTFADDVGSGTIPLVEFPEDAFKSTGLLCAHGKWNEFDSGLANDHTEFSVIPFDAVPVLHTCP